MVLVINGHVIGDGYTLGDCLRIMREQSQRVQLQPDDEHVMYAYRHISSGSSLSNVDWFHVCERHFPAKFSKEWNRIASLKDYIIYAKHRF